MTDLFPFFSCFFRLGRNTYPHHASSCLPSLFVLLSGVLLIFFFSSCATSPSLLTEKAPKLYPPDKLTAQVIEDIAINEVGKREIFDKLPPEARAHLDLSQPHPELPNFRHAGVLENKDGNYLVHIEARPSRPDGRRTVVIGPRGEIVDYKKGFLYSYKATDKPVEEKMPLLSPLSPAFTPSSVPPVTLEENGDLAVATSCGIHP